MASSTTEVGHPNVVSHAEWLAARLEFLTKEKECTRLRELSRQRRTLPWEKVEKRCEFDSTRGKVYSGPNTLSDEVGISVFYNGESSEMFHIYSCYSRGVDMLNGAYHYLDLAPKGRDEAGLKYPMEWLRRHDQY